VIVNIRKLNQEPTSSANRNFDESSRKKSNFHFLLERIAGRPLKTENCDDKAGGDDGQPGERRTAVGGTRLAVMRNSVFDAEQLPLRSTQPQNRA
jgi:hypothetical protein